MKIQVGAEVNSSSNMYINTNKEEGGPVCVNSSKNSSIVNISANMGYS